MYRWVPLKLDFLGAWKSVWLISNPAYLHSIIQEKWNQILEKKIWAKRESGLTAVRLKRDPPVNTNQKSLHNIYHWIV